MPESTWAEWSKHVLRELERLNEGQDIIKKEVQEIHGGMVKLGVLEKQVQEIKHWQDGRKEVCSTTQLAQVKEQVDALNAFKIKAITIFGIAQIVVFIILGVLGT